MDYSFADMINAQNQEDYHLPGGRHVKNMDPLVDRLLESGFFGGSDFLIDDAIRSELEQTAREVIKLARNAVNEGCPVDVLDYRVENAMHHLPVEEQAALRAEFKLPAPHVSEKSIIPIF